MLDLLIITLAADQAPEPEDVKAGWTALVIFLLLILAVVVLAFSLVKQLRKAQAAKDAGVYGDEPVAPGDAAESEGSAQSGEAVDGQLGDSQLGDSQLGDSPER